VAGLFRDPSDSRRYLIQQRLPGRSRANLWEFPGGKVEPGESDAQALARECREELGVEIETGACLYRTLHAYADLEVELVLLAGKILSGQPRPLGAQQLRYALPEEMSKLEFCEADIPLLKRLRDEGFPT
jgi:8-oxo-dGTP diphosphatase